MISHGSVKQPRKRKSSKDDSLDLEARARVTFAATADDPQESEVYDHEGMSNECLHEYLDKVINEANKNKSNPSQIHREDKTKKRKNKMLEKH
jgi:hypothetical protein